MVVVLEKMNMAIAASIGLVAEAIHRHKTPETPTESMLLDYLRRNWYGTDRKLIFIEKRRRCTYPPGRRTVGAG